MRLARMRGRAQGRNQSDDPLPSPGSPGRCLRHLLPLRLPRAPQSGVREGILSARHGADAANPGAAASGLRAAAAILGAATLLLVGACARQAAPAFPFSAAAPMVFVATPEGLAALPPKADASSLAKLTGPAALVPAASVSSANASAIMVAVNRVGPVLIEPDPDCRHYGLRTFQSPEPFARLTAGGAWPRDGGFLVQLYHDPFSLPGSSSGVTLGTLLSVGETGAIQVAGLIGLVSETSSGFGLFALYPAPQGGWLAELRRDEPDKVETRY